MKEKWWWLNPQYWRADMTRVMENHLKFIDRQKDEVVSNFYGSPIKVTDGVYHPAEGSSTHFIADALLRLVKPEVSMLEVGCGSGALSCLAAKLGANRVVAADISDSAYECANHNVKSLGLDKTIEVLKSNLMSNIPEEKFDLIIFNPPLLHCEPIPEERIGKKEYNDIAIDHDGKATLDFIEQAKPYLKDNGTLLLLMSNIGNKNTIEEATKRMSEIGEVNAVSAMYRQSGDQWRFVLAAKAENRIN
jgi:HemK-like putative methylase